MLGGGRVGIGMPRTDLLETLNKERLRYVWPMSVDETATMGRRVALPQSCLRLQSMTAMFESMATILTGRRGQ